MDGDLAAYARLGSVTGALVVTFLLSRLLLWLSKRWNGSGRLVVVHLVCAAISCSLAALGNADGSPLDWSQSGYYLVAQLVWLAVDLFRHQRKTTEVSS